jgi:hypothetical protein
VAGAVLLLFLGPYPVFVAAERSEGSSTS